MKRYLKQSAWTHRGNAEVETTVRTMLQAIRERRDDAIRGYAKDLDRWTAHEFKVPKDEINRAKRSLPESFKEDFALCLRNVTEFAKRQLASLHEFETEIDEGVILGQKLIPVKAVGCYIPGGKYPLISAAIMS